MLPRLPLPISALMVSASSTLPQMVPGCDQSVLAPIAAVNKNATTICLWAKMAVGAGLLARISANLDSAPNYFGFAAVVPSKRFLSMMALFTRPAAGPKNVLDTTFNLSTPSTHNERC